jgi:hypothetical protein
MLTRIERSTRQLFCFSESPIEPTAAQRGGLGHVTRCVPGNTNPCPQIMYRAIGAISDKRKSRFTTARRRRCPKMCFCFLSHQRHESVKRNFFFLGGALRRAKSEHDCFRRNCATSMFSRQEQLFFFMWSAKLIWKNHHKMENDIAQKISDPASVVHSGVDTGEFLRGSCPLCIFPGKKIYTTTLLHYTTHTYMYITA